MMEKLKSTEFEISEEDRLYEIDYWKNELDTVLTKLIDLAGETGLEMALRSAPNMPERLLAPFPF